MAQVFAAVPEVVSGVLAPEAQQAWRDWNPLAWHMIKLRGLLTDPRPEPVQVRPAHSRSLMHYVQILLERARPARVETQAGDAQENSHL
jgi:hypothetical protein